MIVKGVLLVSDVTQDFEKLDISRTDLEISEYKTIEGIMNGINGVGYVCKHVQDPRQLLEAHEKDPGFVVLSIWSGVENRSRRALVPSICETHGIDYIGADPYAAIYTGDKEVAKSICSEFGIKAPKGILIRSENQIDRIRALDYPIVVKPIMEGGSIGITQNSKVEDPSQASFQILDLLKHYSPPILCEEFASGREISFCIIGSDNIVHCQAIEVQIDGEPNYFDNKLFSMQDKRLKERQKKQRFVNVTDEMPQELIERIHAVYKALGKVDYMRIDGKFSSEFYCLELSTDPSISTVSLFAHSYYSIDKTYYDMISDILSTRPLKNGGEI